MDTVFVKLSVWWLLVITQKVALFLVSTSPMREIRGSIAAKKHTVGFFVENNGDVG